MSRGRRHRVRVAVGPLRVDVDQAHLDGAERNRQIPVAAIALVVQPSLFGAPVDVLVGRPDVGATSAEAVGLEAHRLERPVAGEDQQIGPRDLAAVFLLDRPQQPARLVEVHVVGPAVERREALVAAAAAAAPVVDPVGARGMPRHADEERSVVTVIGRPPVLRVGHHRIDVLRQGVEVEAVERLGVVEAVVVGIGLGVVLAEDPQVQLVRPPVLVRCLANGLMGAAHHRALACGVHSRSVRFPSYPSTLSFFPSTAGIHPRASCVRTDTPCPGPRKDTCGKPRASTRSVRPGGDPDDQVDPADRRSLGRIGQSGDPARRWAGGLRGDRCPGNRGDGDRWCWYRSRTGSKSTVTSRSKPTAVNWFRVL